MQPLELLSNTRRRCIVVKRTRYFFEERGYMASYSQDIVIDVDRLNKTEVFGVSIRWGNLTKAIGKVVLQSKIVQGVILAQSHHTTTTLLLNEDESGLLETDIGKMLRRLFPAVIRYAHDDEERLAYLRKTVDPEEHGNGDRHCMAALLGQPSIPLVLQGSTPVLGRWQSVLFFDLDAEGRHTRRVTIHVQGDGRLLVFFGRLKNAFFSLWRKSSRVRDEENFRPHTVQN
ncbi:MAG: hypothetical protein G01um101448_562 [Parcubacteria group bacterium Gr01-1014_48]|nr:MAG: hypothetical protein Greene041614_212 [Parcubacteria group bacterium Greene0416_14]TSC73756.1 MAG: hypothetical protein G01um101448_562 [Parcubacteria group bacterium Gr01-1014_48]TSD01184.1 MAG: hypothetical protein Greene101415_379 [Parcubacteria group bacterium Greene1014_15]TSD08189.1 MAG: hypothetical protein Greene07144_320 [Parcubacteria group bacterium Greene0714_4]